MSSMLGVSALLASASAHEKWFHDPRPFPSSLAGALRPPAVFFILAVVALVGVLWAVHRRFPAGFLPSFERFGASADTRRQLYALIPLILGVHVAVPLLVSGVTGRLFSPDSEMSGAWRYFVGLAETGVALAFFYGGLTRLAAIVLAALWGLGIFLVGLEPMLDNTLYLGFAAFFFLAGRGHYAIDRLVLPRFQPSPEQMARAVPALRIGLGLSLVFVAFTEKLANVPLAQAFLQDYPLNFTSALGIPMSNQTFIYMAGAVELLIGLCIVFNIFTREVVVVAWIPVNMTLTIFNWSELVGHLPIYGVMALLLAWRSTPENTQRWVEGLQARDRGE